MKPRLAVGLMLVCLLLCPLPGLASATESSDTRALETIGNRAVRIAFERLKVTRKTPGLACLTNAGYARFKGGSTRPLYDVLACAAGTTLGKSTLLPVHSSMDAPLWFVFAQRRTSEELMATLVNVDGTELRATNPINVRVNKHQNFEPYRQVFGDRAFSVVTLLNGWADGTPAEILNAATFHDHYCAGVASGHFTVEYIRRHLPLEPGQKYTYAGAPAYCQDDLIMNALNLTPGKSSYVAMQYPWYRAWTTVERSYGNLSGIVIRYDGERKTGTATVLQFEWHEADFKRFIAEPDLQIDWRQMTWLHVWYNRFFLKHLDEPEYFVSPVKSQEIRNEQDYNALVRLGANPLDAILGTDPSW